MEFVLIWLGFAIVTAIAANSRGRGAGGWFFLGLIFGVFALIAVLVMPQVEASQTKDEGSAQSASKPYAGIKKDRLCPHCQKPIEPGAADCLECGAKIAWTPVEGTNVLSPSVAYRPPPRQPEPQKPDEKVCPDCAETIKAAARVCRFCGYRFDGPATS